MSVNTAETDETAERYTSFEEGDEIHPDEFDAFHGCLTAKLEAIHARLPDNYHMEPKYSPSCRGNDRLSILIRSDDFIGNKGEIGDMTFHVILGPRGGLRLATWDRTLGSSGDCDDWDELFRRIKRAK